ncbi:MAG: DUF3142 domain-containing protein [Acidobacteriota bacterium]
MSKRWPGIPRLRHLTHGGSEAQTPRPELPALVAALLLLAWLATAWFHTVRPPVDQRVRLPQIMLWAWERPEDLSFIDPSSTGVAFLAGTLSVRHGELVVRPRLQSLKTPPTTVLESVIRIEVDPDSVLSPAHLSAMVTAISKLGAKPAIRSVQIDFDAARSQRAFYRALLCDLRKEMAPETALSMTALASWALHDRWLEKLPVDDVVPMLFRMGADRHQVRQHFELGGDFYSNRCRSSVGIATDEPLRFELTDRRIYFFNPKAWTPAAYESTLQQYRERRDALPAGRRQRT